jgi:uncharacterized protein YukE
MVQFRVRAESLGEVAGLLQTVIATFDAHVAETDAAVTSVAGKSWKGDDSEMLEQIWTSWQASATGVRQTLEGLAIALRSAEGGYNTTESGLTGAFTQNQGRTNAKAASRGEATLQAAAVSTVGAAGGARTTDGNRKNEGRKKVDS